MREALAGHRDLAQRLDEMEREYDAQFRVVFDAIRALMEQPSPSVGGPDAGPCVRSDCAALPILVYYRYVRFVRSGWREDACLG